MGSKRDRNKPAEQRQEGDRQGAARAQLTQTAHWIAPLPPPNLLADYEELVAGAAERILAMAEQEGQHSRQLEHDALAAERTATILGQICGLVVALAGIGCATWLGLAGMLWPASLMMGGTLAVIVSALVLGRRRQKK